MATAIQFRRGTTAQHANFTGLVGEITVDTDLTTIRVHNGSTSGGVRLATFAELSQVESELGGDAITGVTAGDGLLGGGPSGNVTLDVGAGAGIAVDANNVSVNTAYFDVTAGGVGWAGNLEPSANNTHSLGSPTKVWKDVFVGPNSLVIDGIALSLANGVLQFGGANVAVAGSASSNADTRALFSATDAGGDGSFSYDSVTGAFTYTGPDQTEANSRIDARLSGGTGITYTSGVIATTITQYTDALARAAISVTDTGGDGSLSYDNSTGVITYTGPDQTEANSRIDARLSGGTGITYNSGVIATTITQYTDALARAAISVTDTGGDGSLSYDNSTGVITYTGPSQSEANTRIDARLSGGTGITYTSGVIATTITQYTDALARAAISVTDTGGDGSLAYNSSTGVITYTGPDQTEANSRIDARLSGGTGVTYSSGVISIGQAVGTSSEVSFGKVTTTSDVVVGGNLTVQGTQVILNTTTVETTDTIFRVNSGGATGANVGFEANVGGSIKQIVYTTGNVWSLGSETLTAGTFEGALTGNIASATGLPIVAGTTGTLSVARGGTGVTTSTGTGSVVLSTSPTLVTPVLGTPSSGNIVNTTGLPIVAGTTGTLSVARGGTGVTTSTGTGAVVLSTSPTLVTPALGTPSSGTLTNATGLPIVAGTTGTLSVARGGTGITSFGTGIATFLGTPSSANLAAAVTDETGSGALVFATSPTLVTPALGTPSSGTLTNATGLPIVAGTTGTLSVARGGTGQTTYTNGQLLIGNTTGNTLAKATLTAGTGISVTNGAGAITIAATNNGTVTSVGGTGTVNGLTLTGTVTSTGNLTLGGTLAIAASQVTSGTFADALIPNLNASKITAGTLAVARGGTGVTTSTGTGATVRGTSPTFTTQITVPSIVKSGTSGTGDIGQAANTFNTVFAKATSAQYADLAERYAADDIIESGTVVCFGGEQEITACAHENDHAVAGVISTDPAYMMNSAAGDDATHPYVALTGRVPCKVTGVVNPGDLMVASSVKGHAKANNDAKAGTIIGKAIGSCQGGEAVIEVLITLM